MSGEAAPGIRCRLEYPFTGTVIDGEKVLVGGWAFVPGGEDVDVDVYIDGKLTERSKWGAARYDVFREFGTEPSYESGFFTNVNVAGLSKGAHELEVRATSGGREVSVGKSRIIQPFWYTIKRKPKAEYAFKYLENTFLPIGAAAGSARKSGARHFKAFMGMVDLPGNADVLEVGCGMGRFSLPFTRHVRDGGSYTGLELLPTAVRYLKENFAPRFPHFSVEQVDVFNDLYNPDCAIQASDYVFPFADGSFDLVFLQSVFTHLVSKDVENYLKQIHRVLCPGGRSMITYFVIDEHSSRRIAEKKTNRTFAYQHDNFRSDTEQVIEIAIAYDEEWIRETYDRIGFEVEAIHLGAWRGEGGATGQDVVVALKRD